MPDRSPHDIVIASRSDPDAARRFSTQHVTRSAPFPRSHQALLGRRCAIVVNVESYATPVPARQTTLKAIRNYATIADATDAIFELVSCCARRGVIAVTH